MFYTIRICNLRWANKQTTNLKCHLVISKYVPKSLYFKLSYKIPTRVCWKKNNSPLFSITVMNKLFKRLSRKHLASWAKTPTQSKPTHPKVQFFRNEKQKAKTKQKQKLQNTKNCLQCNTEVQTCYGFMAANTFSLKNIYFTS